MKKEFPRNLQDLWENAIERAVEEKSNTQDLNDEKLGEAAGVHIKSGVRASGLWGTTTSCTCNNCVS